MQEGGKREKGGWPDQSYQTIVEPLLPIKIKGYMNYCAKGEDANPSYIRINARPRGFDIKIPLQTNKIWQSFPDLARLSFPTLLSRGPIMTLLIEFTMAGRTSMVQKRDS